MAQKNDYIAVFDSGVGGISVLRQLLRVLPNEKYLYFGDSINAPYGVRPEEEVRELRQAQNNTPVLFLSAKGTLQDRVTGLDAGADDYLPKPFAGSELRARVRALLRRRTDYVPDRLVFADLELDAGSCELICKENHVTLSRKAYQVMEAFMRDPHVIISPEQLMERTWGRNSESEIHVVWVNVSFLRKQLKQLGSRTYIRTLRGTGYSLEEQR